MFPNLKDGSEKPGVILKLVSVIFLLLILSFVGIGLYKIILAMSSDYNLTALDLTFFTSGLLILGVFTAISLLTDIKAQNKTIAKGVLHLLKNKLGSDTRTLGSSANFNDALGDLFKNQSGLFGPGSISLFDLNNPDTPLFKGEFNNMDEMNDLKKNIMDKMRNSPGEFKGKKMSKQEILEKMSDAELEQERLKAVEKEDWTWASLIRDEVSRRNEQKDTDL